MDVTRGLGSSSNHPRCRATSLDLPARRHHRLRLEHADAAAFVGGKYPEFWETGVEHSVRRFWKGGNRRIVAAFRNGVCTGLF